MTDTEKVKLINRVVMDSREFGGEGESGYWLGILDAIGSICDYEEEKDA